jgi:hypothetical protein
MLVTGASSAWLAFFFEGQLKAFEIARDQAMIDRLIENSRRFWDHVQHGKPPELDPARDVFVPSGDLTPKWLSAAAAWRAGDAQQAALEAQLEGVKKKKDLAQKILVDLMGEFLLGEGYGVKVTRYLQKGALDYQALLKELLPDTPAQTLEGFRKPATPRVRTTASGAASAPPEVEETSQEPETPGFWF